MLTYFKLFVITIHVASRMSQVSLRYIWGSLNVGIDRKSRLILDNIGLKTPADFAFMEKSQIINMIYKSVCSQR